MAQTYPEIVQRDGHECFDCGRTSEEGYILYEEEGTERCIFCYTQDRIKEARETGIYSKVSAIVRSVYYSGLRTRGWRAEHRVSKESEIREYLFWLSRHLEDYELELIDRGLADKISQIKYE